MQPQQCALIIPSLSPDERLPSYVQELLQSGFGEIVVIDDGSAPSYQEIFERISAWERVTVLHHAVNQGKGMALKTGTAYVEKHTAFEGIITADADGQHTAPDTLKMAAALKEGESVLLLGSRDFSLKNKQIPAKSRMGNRITSGIFRLLYGHWLPDTQTGLRAFPRALFAFMQEVDGARFEYEMNVLMHCAGKHVAMDVVPIETVYHDDNKGSHFHPVRDSWRIYKLLFRNIAKFASASLVATILDLALFTLLNSIAIPQLIPKAALVSLFKSDVSVQLATYIARVCSASLNFKLNQNFVFNLKKCKGATLRYIVLVVGVMLVSGWTVGMLSQLLPGLNSTICKVMVDLPLFFVNYQIQKNWVFAEPGKKKGEMNA